MTDGTLDLTATSVGDKSAGTFSQSGGTTTITSSCRIGEYSTGVGSMLISGGTLDIRNVFDGFVGTGTLNIADGYFQANFLYAAHDPASKGVVTIGGGTLATNYATFGENGSSVVNQFGGFVSTNGGQLDIGAGTTSTATYSMFDGTVSVVDGPEIIGDFGDGTFIQAQGSNIISRLSNPDDSISKLLIAYRASSTTGRYILSGTGSLSVGFGEYVAYSGNGTFVQTGGSNFASALFVGSGAGSNGTFTLSSAGALTTTNGEFIGNDGAGTFIQSGGTNSLGAGQPSWQMPPARRATTTSAAER